jgi:hypothetical protein
VYYVIWQPWSVISLWHAFLYTMQLTHWLALGTFRVEAVSCLLVTFSLHGDLEQLAVSYTTLAEHRTSSSGLVSSEEICSKLESDLQTRGEVSASRLHSKREQIAWKTCVCLGEVLRIWCSHSKQFSVSFLWRKNNQQGDFDLPFQRI